MLRYTIALHNQKESGMQDSILLKKYANRRLYDTVQSKYVTLSEVAALIRDGRRVEIRDAKTKEDVTAFILTQIVLEEARRNNILLPAPLLHTIIQYGDNALVEFFDKHLQQTISAYLAYKSSVDEQFKQWLGMGMNLSRMSGEGMPGMNPLHSIFENFAGRRETDEEDAKKE
jgi:polyhydroxyalkanoate synthesis repressor PhaR